ncbi:MAG: hypothetical protein PUA81_08295 [Oscillospiraceae bacterium]|nr:hypothetical protein [Oscillospiraceae bacterium]
MYAGRFTAETSGVLYAVLHLLQADGVFHVSVRNITSEISLIYAIRFEIKEKSDGIPKGQYPFGRGMRGNGIPLQGKQRRIKWLRKPKRKAADLFMHFSATAETAI